MADINRIIGPVEEDPPSDSHSCLQTSAEDMRQSVHPHHHNGNDLIFGRLFDTALHGIMILEGDSGRVTNVNPFLSELLGYAQHELTGKSLWDTVPFKDIDVSQADLRKLLRHDSVHFEKLPLAGRDGRQIHVEFTSVSFLAEQKKYIQCKVQDITEKALIAEKLRESEEKYRNVFDNALEGIIVVQDGILKLSNPRSSLKMEYTDEELTSRPFLDFVHQDDREFVKKLYLDELKGANDFDEAEFRVVDKSGNISTLEIRAIIIDWEGKPAILGFLRDITDKKTALENLKRSEEKYRTILEEIDDVYFEVDLKGDYTFVNEAMTRHLGWSKKEIAGMSYSKTVSEEDADTMFKACNQVYKTGKPTKYITFTAVKKDGTTGTGQVAFFPLKNEAGGIIGFRGIGRDITEHKLLEDEIMKAAKLESLALLAGGIAHDYNNILTAILGNISLAKNGIAPDNRLYTMLDEAEKASARAKGLTQQLLTFASGGMPVKKITSLARLLKSATTFALSGSRVKCEFTVPDNLREVEVDEGQFSQAINNIVINAKQAMDNEGVLQIRAENIALPAAQGPVLPEGYYVRITIEDHGIGIARENLEKIFDPYFTTRKKGSGLGLTTAYSIIKKHNGLITVESKVKAGTRFHIYLPAPARAPAGEEPRPEKRQAATKKILVMDDEQTIRDIASRMLKHLGFTDIVTANNGSEALALYEKAMADGEPFNIVIMDLTVPGNMGGKEAIKELLKLDPGAQAVVSSGYASDPIISDYQRYGFSGVLVKPYTMEELKSVISNITG